MKLEYFDDYREGERRGLLLFYLAQGDQLGQLRRTFHHLSDGIEPRVEFHELPFVEPVGGCRVVAYRGEEDEGVEPLPAPGAFRWVLSAQGWRDAEALVERLAEGEPEGEAEAGTGGAGRLPLLNKGPGPEVVYAPERSF